MNIEDLIKKYESLEGVWNANGAEIARHCFLRDLKRLNAIDTKKVTVPQYVADWIEYCKTNGIALGYALYCSGQASDKKVYDWIVESLENQETFARAWIDGYTVDKEKRYLVKMKDLETGFNFLNRHKRENYWLFSSKDESVTYEVHHTRKELEEAGFGEVFNSPLFEVEEVTE